MGVLLGLAAALLWGSGDMLINRLTVRIGTSRSLVLTQLMSLLCWIVMVLIYGYPAGATSNLWGMAILAGVFHVLGLTLTYRAFEVGTLSIVSPIASSFAIVTVVVAFIMGEQTPLMPLTGALLLVAGTVFVTRSPSTGGTATMKGIPEALGSALCFGIMFWMIDSVAEKGLGFYYPLMILKVMASVSAITTVMIAKKKGIPEQGEGGISRLEIVGLAAGIALSDSLAWAAWLFGAQLDSAAITTALASLFSAVTVVLAAIFLKERLSKGQMAGVAVIFLGILLVSLPAPAEAEKPKPSSTVTIHVGGPLSAIAQ